MSDSVGFALKEARRRLGLRVKDVAARTSAKISPSYLSCIENDLRLPSEELLLELGEILGLDRRALYMQLIRVKAPEFLRDQFETPGAPRDPAYEELKELPLEELVRRAAEASEARRELVRLRREVAKHKRTDPAEPRAKSFLADWQQQAARYRMQIEKNVVEAELSLEGDLLLRRHVIGLKPQHGKPPVLAIQHTVRTPYANGESDPDGFKLLEQPSDLSVEIEREPASGGSELVRILFPDGLAAHPRRARRVSYTLQSRIRGAYRMEEGGSSPASADTRADALRDEGGVRATFVVFVDKPCEELDLEIHFPRYYVPREVMSWAGTQDFHDSEDNLIEERVCESWELEQRRDYRVRLRVMRPLVGHKFGIAWRPVHRPEFERVRQRLQLEAEESTG